MKLRNVANFCYANATMLCLWWSLLGRHDYCPGDWNISADAIRHLFSHAGSEPVDLTASFAAVFAHWNHGHLPADAAEFTLCVLRWMRSKCFSHRWERSYDTENVLTVHDIGDEHAPLLLQVPHRDITSIGLQDMIHLWTQAYGMHTFMLAAPDLVVCHIDRNADLSDGQVVKLSFWLHADHVCTLPVKTSNGDLLSQDYVPLALLAHIGDVTGGHYRAALRLTVSENDAALHTQNTLWALTDDHVEPKIYDLPGLPAWLCRNITLVWLVRRDKADIYRPLSDPDSGRLRLRTLRQAVARNVAVAALPCAAPEVPTITPSAPLPESANDVDAMAHLVQMMRSQRNDP
eukprot:s493_g2.t3